MELVADVGLAVGARQPGDSARGGEITAEGASRPESLRGTLALYFLAEMHKVERERDDSLFLAREVFCSTTHPVTPISIRQAADDSL